MPRCTQLEYQFQQLQVNLQHVPEKFESCLNLDESDSDLDLLSITKI